MIRVLTDQLAGFVLEQVVVFLIDLKFSSSSSFRCFLPTSVFKVVFNLQLFL